MVPLRAQVKQGSDHFHKNLELNKEKKFDVVNKASKGCLIINLYYISN